MYNWQKTALISGFLYHIHKPGAYLLSRKAVPSALEGLTAGFGMGPGVSPLTKHQIYEYEIRMITYPTSQCEPHERVLQEHHKLQFTPRGKIDLNLT